MPKRTDLHKILIMNIAQRVVEAPTDAPRIADSSLAALIELVAKVACNDKLHRLVKHRFHAAIEGLVDMAVRAGVRV